MKLIFAVATPPAGGGKLSHTCPGSIPGAGHLFRYVTNQLPKANSAFDSSGVGKRVPASAGKAKAGIPLADERGVFR